MIGAAPVDAQTLRRIDDQPIIVQQRPDRVRMPDDAFVGGMPWEAIPEQNLPDDARLARVVLSDAVRQAVEELESNDWATRERAAAALREGGDIDEQLMAVLQRRTLAAEARHRVLGILCDRLAEAPRGALGIRMAVLPDGRPGVEVNDLLPGMPAEKVLRRGDRILSIDGREVSRMDSLISIVQVERPGQRVTLEIDRPTRDAAGREVRDANNFPVAERMVVEMVLASSEQLDKFDSVQMGGGMMGGGRGGAQQARTARLRAAQVQEAIERFGVPAVDVPVAVRVLSSELSVEEHPELRDLLTARQQVLDGELDVTPAMRMAWMETVTRLRAQSMDERLPESTRAFLRQVAARYAESIPR